MLAHLGTHDRHLGGRPDSYHRRRCRRLRMLSLRNRTTRGAALLEALVALTVLGGALLTLVYMQLRTQADSESALRRAQALHLIDDLAERVRANPRGFNELAGYRMAWRTTPAADVDCEAQTCATDQLVRWDLAQWKSEVARALPDGDATVFDSPEAQAGTQPRLLGVMVAWRARNDDDFELAVPGASCPAGHACQFGHVHP
ncbi:MAG: type IV pilus modification protein PilV [Proteobacteria bacterium]|nr:type IV pilus modification protein PilV [Pseudomonadota bacterium]